MRRSNRLPTPKLNRRSAIRTPEQFEAFLAGGDAPKPDMDDDPRIETVTEAMARTVPGRGISAANLRVLARAAVEIISREPVTYRAPWDLDAPFE